MSAQSLTSSLLRKDFESAIAIKSKVFESQARGQTDVIFACVCPIFWVTS